MTFKAIMNGAGALGHGAGSTITGGAFTLVSTPSTKAFAPSNGPGVFRGDLKYSFSGGSAAGFVPGSLATPADQVIKPTATKTFVDDLPVIRKDDFGVMAVEGELLNGNPGVTAGPVMVVDPGQTKAEGV